MNRGNSKMAPSVVHAYKSNLEYGNNFKTLNWRPISFTNMNIIQLETQLAGDSKHVFLEMAPNVWFG